jgi:hypothetical protein
MEQTCIVRDAEESSVLRHLKIKLGVCVRMTKEVAYYKREAQDNQEIVSQLSLGGADEWQLKQPTMCVEESYDMVQESGNRLQTGSDELYSYIMRFGEDPSLCEGEGLRLKQEAESLLADSCS